MSWYIIAAIIVFLIIRQWRIKSFIEVANKVKCGVRSYPIIGHAYLFIGDGARRMRGFQKLGLDAIKNGGKSNMWLGEKYYLVTVDPVDIEVILKTSLEKSNVVRFMKDITGNGTIFAPVAIWHSRRKGIAPIFNQKNLRSYTKVFVRQNDILVDQLGSVAETGVVSFWNYVRNIAFDSICETAMGLKHKGTHQLTVASFLRAVDAASRLIAKRMVQPWLYFNSVYKILSYHDNLMTNKRIIYDFIDEVIKSKRKALKMKSNKSSADDVKSVMEMLMESSKNNQSFTDLEILEEILVLLIAGSETSAIGICFVMCMMARYQDVQEKVAQELLEVFGDSNRDITEDDLSRLEYLDAVVKETLRLYPPVPVIVREIEKDITLPSGLTLVNGCAVLVNIWATHRNPVYWGEDAQKFRPERFIQEPSKHPAAYLPFSTGPRNCLGYSHAKLFMKISVATILRKYRILNPNDNTNTTEGKHMDELMKVTFDILMKDLDGFKVKIEKRYR